MKSIGPIVENSEAFIISKIFHTTKNSILYIGKDDREIINIQNKLSWLLPNQKVLLYKAWDQIPYDNISPSKEVQTSRLKTLNLLNSNQRERKILLTTVNAVIQKIIPKNKLNESFDARASVNALVSLSASYNDLISAPVWSAVADASIPSSLE